MTLGKILLVLSLVLFFQVNYPSTTLAQDKEVKVKPKDKRIVVRKGLVGDSVATAAGLTVNTTGDLPDIDPGDGVCSTGVTITGGPHAGKLECTLRAAIMEANATAGEDTIEFDIPGPNPVTISPLSALPPITDPVIIDGTTQKPDTANTPPKIVLNGGNTAGVANGLEVGGGSIIRGLTIINFAYSGIHIQGAANYIEGCFIGIDGSGIERPNRRNGIAIEESSSNTIGGIATVPGTPPGNVISGNDFYGIYIINSSTGNSVMGNLIGTNIDGDGKVANFNGIVIDNSSGNYIGSLVEGEGNVISGNDNYGICIINSPIGNSVMGNLIGTNKDGDGEVANFNGIVIDNSSGNYIGGLVEGAGNVISGNDSRGVSIQNSSTGNKVSGNLIGTNKDGDGSVGNRLYGVAINNASNNTIGGVEEGAGNVISGNRFYGVRISDSSTGNKVLGNLIGTNKDGDGSVGNRGYGVAINNASNNTIGGVEEGAGNVISGNMIFGVSISYSSTGNTVSGNLIGTNKDGDAVVANGDGVSIYFGASENFIGGIAEGAGNVISGNRLSGVSISDSSTGNKVLGNLIGTNKDGDAAVANGSDGVSIYGGASGNYIGGIVEGAGNVISGNVGYGVIIEGRKTTKNKVKGNFIGTDRYSETGLYNGSTAILIRDGANDNIIGGGELSARNFIWTKDEVAVKVDGPRSIKNAILSNVIAIKEINPVNPFWRLGIDLVGDERDGFNTLTPNDDKDTDNGPNHLQNFPVLSSVQVDSAGVLDISGELKSKAGKDYLIQLYKSDCNREDGDMSYDYIFQGIFRINNRKDDGNKYKFSFIGPDYIFVVAGDFISATATLLHDYTEVDGKIDVYSGETSEFSWPCVEVTQKPE